MRKGRSRNLTGRSRQTAIAPMHWVSRAPRWSSPGAGKKAAKYYGNLSGSALVIQCGRSGSRRSPRRNTLTEIIGGDPIKAGLVASTSRPDNNVIGVTQLSNVLITKRLELACELLPNVGVVGFLLNTNSPNADIRSVDVQKAAHSIGQQIRILYTSKEADFETVFATLVRDGIAALIVQNDTLFNNGRERLGALAVRQGIPVLHKARDQLRK